MCLLHFAGEGLPVPGSTPLSCREAGLHVTPVGGLHLRHNEEVQVGLGAEIHDAFAEGINDRVVDGSLEALPVLPVHSEADGVCFLAVFLLVVLLLGGDEEDTEAEGGNGCSKGSTVAVNHVQEPVCFCDVAPLTRQVGERYSTWLPPLILLVWSSRS